MGFFNYKNPISKKLAKTVLSELELAEALPFLDSQNISQFAKQPWLTAEILTDAIKYLEEDDFHWIFDHKKCPSHVISEWAMPAIKDYFDSTSHYDPDEIDIFIENLYSAVSNPNCPGKVLEKAFGIDDDIDEAISRNPNVTIKIVDKILKKDELIKIKSLCLNFNLSEAAINKIIAINYSEINKVLLKNPKINSRQLKAIQASVKPQKTTQNRKLKEATDMWTSQDDLHALTRSVERKVRIAAATNLRLPTKSIESLIENEESAEVLLSLYKSRHLNELLKSKLMERLDDMHWHLPKSESHLYDEINTILEDYYERY